MSEENSSDRRRRGLRVAGTAVLLVVVVGAPGAASWHGLTAVGREWLGLSGGWDALVPLVFDAAAAYAAVLALRDVLCRDTAASNRMLVWLYAAGSAALQVWHAPEAPAAMFFAAASVSAVVLWDRTLRALRRRELRAVGAVQPPTPRFRMARWLVAPGETWAAWRLAVVEGVTDPEAAVARVRAERAPARELADLSTADAVRRAVAATGSRDQKELRAWLSDRGVRVGKTYVFDVLRRTELSAASQSNGNGHVAGSRS